jgi:FemAB-related protein (PEP-CTERM system-associated)
MLAALTEDGRIAGILPLVSQNSLLFGRFLTSQPFVSYGGPLGSDEATRALVDRANGLATASAVDLLELRSRTPLTIDLPVSHRKITVVLDLPDPGRAEELWDGFDANIRRRVRRSQKAGVEVRFGTEELPAFCRVFTEHMRDLGTPSHAPKFFQAIVDQFPDVWIGCAYVSDEPIAAIMGFEWRSEFEVTYAAALIRHKQLAANMHLYWACMERAIERGLKVFNFGRCTPGSGTHRFKSQWGARDEALWWYQNARSESTRATPSPDDPRYALGPRLWRHLPLPITRILGPRIVKKIP